MAKVLKAAEKKEVRFSDLEFRVVLDAQLKTGGKLDVLVWTKKAGSMTMYVNKHKDISYEALAKFALSRPPYDPEEATTEEEIEFE